MPEKMLLSMFTIIPIIIGVIFVIVIGTLIARFVHFAAQKTKPVIEAGAMLIDKREHIWRSGGVNDVSTHTSYYATFELENGQRMELAIPDHKIGLIVKGDTGMLSYQGTLFVAFNRVS